MKNIVLFPYHPDIRILINHKDYLVDCRITGFISYKEDARLIRSLNKAMELKDKSFIQLIQKCDAVVFLDNYRDYKYDKYYEVIDAAIKYQKEVLITPLAKTKLNLESYAGQCHVLETLPDDFNLIDSEFNETRVFDLGPYKHEIETPIMAVLGLGKHCDKFENQLLIKETLSEEYDVTVVCSNALGSLFGCYSLPSFLFESISFQEKIIKFNYYINKILKHANPDLIVIGVPEGIAPFKKKEFHHFAEYPLVISNAVSIDIAILCTYFMNDSRFEASLMRLRDFCENKFNIPIGAFSISRTRFEIPNEVHERVFYDFLSATFLDKHYPDLSQINLPIINILDRNFALKTIKLSIKPLQENVKAI